MGDAGDAGDAGRPHPTHDHAISPRSIAGDPGIPGSLAQPKHQGMIVMACPACPVCLDRVWGSHPGEKLESSRAPVAWNSAAIGLLEMVILQESRCPRPVVPF